MKDDPQSAEIPTLRAMGRPREDHLIRGHSFDGDLRTLPQIPPEKFERPEREEPQASPTVRPVVLGSSRTTTTDTNGNYTFLTIPAGTYPSITASNPGYLSVAVSSAVVEDGGTTTQNFSLSSAPTSGCLVDTSQADFQAGAITNCDLTGSPGDVTLLNGPNIDQQNTTLSNSGVGITITTWGGQTFTSAVTGQPTRVDVNLFCSGCTGITPNLTLSLRATTGGLPTGPDLASATISGFNSGAGGYFTANFSSAPTTPNPVPRGSTTTSVVMTITTMAPTMSALQRLPRFYADWLGATGMGLIGVVIGVRRKSRRKTLILGALSLMVLLMAIGCGALRQTQGTPSGTNTVTVTGATTSFTHSTSFRLIVN